MRAKAARGLAFCLHPPPLCPCTISLHNPVTTVSTVSTSHPSPGQQKPPNSLLRHLHGALNQSERMRLKTCQLGGDRKHTCSTQIQPVLDRGGTGLTPVVQLGLTSVLGHNPCIHKTRPGSLASPPVCRWSHWVMELGQPG